MSQNVEIVRRSFEAWNEGDVPAIRRCYTEDAVIETPITEFGRTFEGDDPLGRWIREMRGTAETHWGDVERTPPGGPGHASAGGGAVRSAPALATTTNAIAATSRAARP